MKENWLSVAISLVLIAACSEVLTSISAETSINFPDSESTKSRVMTLKGKAVQIQLTNGQLLKGRLVDATDHFFTLEFHGQTSSYLYEDVIRIEQQQRGFRLSWWIVPVGVVAAYLIVLAVAPHD
jgi:hypothetical protein